MTKCLYALIAIAFISNGLALSLISYISEIISLDNLIVSLKDIAEFLKEHLHAAEGALSSSVDVVPTDTGKESLQSEG